MRVCIITSAKFPPEEGIGKYIYNLSKNLIQSGHQVTILTRGSFRSDEIVLFEGIRLIKIRFLKIYPFYMLIHGLFINRYLKYHSNEFDIINIHSPLCPDVDTSLPTLITIHTPMIVDAESIDVDNFETSIRKFMAKYISYPLEKKIFRKGKIVTTVSESVRKELWRYNLDISKVLVVRNGVNTDLFIPLKNIEKAEKYILFVGRLDYRKGVIDLIECAKILSESNPGYCIFIVGKGPLKNEVETKIKEYSLEKFVKLIGFVDESELVTYYQNASIFIIPSHYEGLPTVLLEAMACGLPVIATAISGNIDLIISGKNGILIPKNSPSIMAETINSLMKDTDMRNSLGCEARKIVELYYNWPIISDGFTECFENARKK